MASKSKKRSKQRTSIDPLVQIQRLFERGDYRQALKEARVSYRRSATPQLRSLLEHIYVGRVQQLVRQNQRADARRIASELLDLGVTEPSVQSALPELLLAVGLLDRLPAECELPADQREHLQVRIVDQAVLRPQDTPQSMAEVRQDAQKIRAALEAVEQENETAALALLRGIPRESLFADWRFFVRGLIAYYRRDRTEMLASWDRLDPDRSAAQIAAPLKLMAGAVPMSQDARLVSKVGRLERQATSQPVLNVLLKLRHYAADRNWDETLRVFRTVAAELRKLDPEINQRVVACLAGSFIHDGQLELLDRLAKFADPPPIDPRWNRAQAVVREQDRDGEAYFAWEEYLQDLKGVTCLSPDERKLARAMVHLHMAKDDAEDAADYRNCSCGMDHSEEVQDSEEAALEHFRSCLALAPDYKPCYVVLAKFHEEAGRQEEEAEVYLQWLKQEPDDTEVLELLCEYYLEANEPLKAREYAERARQLKPLDKPLVALLRKTHLECAQQFAREKKFNDAREELGAADRLAPDQQDDYCLLALRAALETKAGELNSARAYLEQAQENLNEPTALWLAMSIASIDLGLPKDEIWLYEKRWRDALKRRCNGQTAGRLCHLLGAQLAAASPYQGSDEHAQVLLAYIRRCSRVKWQLEDLRDVCGFLQIVEDQKTLAKIAKRGIRQFPKTGFLHFYAATAELFKGNRRMNRYRIADQLDDAIEFGSSSDDPRDKMIVRDAQRVLAMLEGHDRQAAAYYEDDESPYGDDEQDGSDDPMAASEFDMMYNALMRLPPEMIERMVKEACRQSGMDPEEVLEELYRRRNG